jgi:predicted DNA-binding transcriptional regulator YafY
MAKDSITERYLFIELLAWWEGAVSNKQLVKQFHITRQQAYTDIKKYLVQYPENLQQCNGALTPSVTFKPQYISHDVNQYLEWFSFGKLTVQPISQQGACALSLPSRAVSAKVIRALVRGIREQKRVEVDYVSLSHPESDGRIFHPHTFVNTGLRWHVRGYCEKSQGYRDLVLSRFRGDAELLDASIYTIDADLAWHTQLTLVLQPDPRLSPDKQLVLANDYQMEGGQLILSIKAALANYLLQELQVNTKMLDGVPEAQQLVLVNQDDIKPWLFSH